MLCWWVVLLPHPWKWSYFGVLWIGVFVDLLTYIKWNISFYTRKESSFRRGWSYSILPEKDYFLMKQKINWYFDYYTKYNACFQWKKSNNISSIGSLVVYSSTVALSVTGFFSSLNLYSSVSSVCAQVSVTVACFTEKLYHTFRCGGQDSLYWKCPATLEGRVLAVSAAFMPCAPAHVCLMCPAFLTPC